MAKCGITKYDNLPGRVGFTDVDALRYALGRNFKQHERLVKKLDKAYDKDMED